MKRRAILWCDEEDEGTDRSTVQASAPSVDLAAGSVHHTVSAVDLQPKPPFSERRRISFKAMVEEGLAEMRKCLEAKGVDRNSESTLAGRHTALAYTVGMRESVKKRKFSVFELPRF